MLMDGRAGWMRGGALSYCWSSQVGIAPRSGLQAPIYEGLHRVCRLGRSRMSVAMAVELIVLVGVGRRSLRVQLTIRFGPRMTVGAPRLALCLGGRCAVHRGGPGRRRAACAV